MAASSPVAHFGLFERYREAIKAGNDVAREDTFQKPLGPTTHKLYQATQVHPSLQFIFPFWKTPYNVLAEGLKRTPLAAVKAIYDWKSGKTNDIDFTESAVKSAMGTTIMLLAAQAAIDGSLTGGGPADPKQNETLRGTGWQPYSKKEGNQYISFARAEPFATILGIGADLGEAWKSGDISHAQDLMEKAVQSAGTIVLDKSMIQGVAAIVNMLSDPQHKGKTAMKSLQSSLIPNAVGGLPFGNLARAMDPYYRETELGFGEASPFKAQVPGLSKTLVPQRSPTGEPRERKGTFIERLISPFQRSELKSGPLAEVSGEMSRLDMTTPPPPPYYRIGAEKIYYTREEREEIAQAQQHGMRKVAEAIKSSRYQNLPDDVSIEEPDGMTKQKMVMSIINRYRTPVVKRVNRIALQRAKASS
jgi:hypothetical protein